MLLGQICLGNNLPTHIKENTDSFRQKPRQLPSAAANFEGCSVNGEELFQIIMTIFYVYSLKHSSEAIDQRYFYTQTSLL